MVKSGKRWVHFLLAFAMVLSCGANPVMQTETLWDRWGVPHIFAKDAPELFEAFGWAQMHNHGDLILRLYGQARGRAAEYWGERKLESDRKVWAMGIPDRAREWYAAQKPEFRSYLDAFAAGMNAYAARYPNRISSEVRAVLPVTGVDVLAHIQRVVHFTFLIAGDPQFSAMEGVQRWQMGSNAWALAPRASATGNAMLLVNPHLPWAERFRFFEAHLVAPGLEAYGCALVGMPMLVMAFNDRIGWAHTINQHNGWGLYELTLKQGGYAFDGEVRPLDIAYKTLKVKQEGGDFREETLEMARSLHGPIIARQGNKAIALKVTGLDRPGLLEQYWNMARAQNLSDFERALQPLQLPLFSILYGDRDGHIFHLFNGQIPVRPSGDWETWLKPVPGNTSATLWTATHPYSDLPKVTDPPSGWLQNANDPPWTTTFPPVLEAKDYPPYFSGRGMSLRAQRSVKLLQENLPMTFEKLVQSKFSSRVEGADRILDELIAAARQQDSPLAREAAAVLARWDRQTEATSRGAVLFALWAQSVDIAAEGLRDPLAAVAALERAARRVKQQYGRLDVPWGEVFRVRAGQYDMPANGGDGNLGIFSVLQFAPAEEGRFQAVFGDSFIAAIEFSNPIRAQVLLPYGNATQPGSPHIGDQLPLYTRKQLRPVLRVSPPS